MELAAWRLEGRRDGPRVLITGGVHGDEYEPMLAVRRLAGALERGQGVSRGRVTLVPVVNEAALRLGRRTAEDGLDLARICPGRPDGSITERAADALATLIRDADYYLDLHTGGLRLRVHPMAGYMLHPEPVVLERQRRMARVFGLPIVWGTDPNLEGRSLSVARDANVPAIYVESLGGAGCDPKATGVSALVRGCLDVLTDLGVVEGEVVPSLPPGAPIVVEDGRPNSGFLQIQHPAPREGIFEPAVALGQPVQGGDILGTVADVLGREMVPIAADRAGLVLVLHAVAPVARGEGVAVVLETDRTLTLPGWLPPEDAHARPAPAGRVS